MEVKETDSSVNSVSQARQTTAIALGVSCLVVSTLALLYTADYIFTWLPKMEDVFKSVKVHISIPVQIILQWGLYLWLAVVLCLVLSGVETWRKPGHPRTLALQVATGISALLLIILLRFAAWNPFLNLLQGIGTQS